jgi:hypothetical protein
MEQITAIGLDLATNVLQVHGVDGAGRVLVRRQLRRAEVPSFFAALPPCPVGMEACGTAHHWARALTKPGHTVRLMPPADVEPYVQPCKTDAFSSSATAIIPLARKGDASKARAAKLIERKSARLVSVALANRDRAHRLGDLCAQSVLYGSSPAAGLPSAGFQETHQRECKGGEK